jgi:hypothetical protein
MTLRVVCQIINLVTGEVPRCFLDWALVAKDSRSRIGYTQRGRRGGRGRPHLQGVPMGWLGAVAAGLAVRGAMRRRRQRDAAIEVARLKNVVDELTVHDRAEYTVWPPEDVDGR